MTRYTHPSAWLTACLVATLAFASPSFAQQVTPQAKSQAGLIVNAAPSAITVAPAGGGLGVGRPVAEDAGLTLQGRNATTHAKCTVGVDDVCSTAPGGGGGGGGGAITAASGSFASGAFSAGSHAAGSYVAGSLVDGAIVTFGAQADSACGSDGGTCSIEALIKRQLSRMALDTSVQQLHVDLTTGTVTTQLVDTVPGGGTVTAADVGTTTIAGQGGVTLITGTPTANSFQVWTVSGKSSVNLTVTGTFVATINLEGSSDNGATYAPISALLRGASTTTQTITAPAVLSAEVAGFDHVRVRASAYTSGTPTLTPRFSSAPGPVKLTNPLVAGTNVIGQVGAVKHLVSSTLTRVANTVTYGGTATAPQAICLFTTTTVCAPPTVTVSSTAAVNGLLLDLQLVKSSTGATGATFIVEAYQSAPTLTATFDGTVYTPKLADATSGAHLGTWTCATPKFNSDNSSYDCVSSTNDGHQPYQVTGGALYFLIETTGLYAPTSGETFTVNVGVVQSLP